MARHVDILKVDPHAGVESVLARVVLDDQDEIVIEASDQGYWRDALVRAVHIDPADDPEGFLYALAERLDGTYVIATEPHEGYACEYEPAPDAAPA